jgi:hypothetical protein
MDVSRYIIHPPTQQGAHDDDDDGSLRPILKSARAFALGFSPTNLQTYYYYSWYVSTLLSSKQQPAT